jgi:hypothetical protein
VQKQEHGTIDRTGFPIENFDSVCLKGVELDSRNVSSVGGVHCGLKIGCFEKEEDETPRPGPGAPRLPGAETLPRDVRSEINAFHFDRVLDVGAKLSQYRWKGYQ